MSKQLEAVNASGYLLQLKLEREAESNKKLHLFQSIRREVLWKHPDTGEAGFIDLVLDSGRPRLIIEAKRVSNEEWIFLLPEWRGDQSPLKKTTRARLVWLCRRGGDAPVHDSECAELHTNPESYEAAFCVLKPEGQGKKQSLEAMCRELLQSVEAHACQERSFETGPSAVVRVLVPVIVTTAKLWAMYFDVDAVSLEDGMLKSDATEQCDVPWVRFRKPLSTEVPSSAADLGKLVQASERTVFIVQAKHFVGFLAQFRLQDNDPALVPWREFL